MGDSDLELGDDISKTQIYDLTIPSVDGSGLEARLFLPPGKGPHPAVLFNDGLTPSSPNSLEKLYKMFISKKGLGMLVPMYEGHRNHRLEPVDAEHVVSAYEYLQAQPMVDEDRTWMLGFSYGGLLSLIGAADERIRDKVPIVVTAAAPTDVEPLLAYSRSDPNASESIREIVDDTIIYNVKDHIRDQQKVLQGKDPDYRDLYIASEILSSKSAYEVFQLMDSFSQGVQDRIRFFSAVERAPQIDASVLLLHGMDDATIPFEQADTMRKAIVQNGGDATCIELDGVGHALLRDMLNEIADFVKGKQGDNFLG